MRFTHINKPTLPASQRPVATIAQGLKWQCLGGSHAWLFSKNAADWTKLRQNLNAQIVKDNPLRQVFKITTLDGKTLYAKIYHAKSPLTQLKWLIQSPPAKNEFDRLITARQRNVPTPQPVAWAVGTKEKSTIAILITQAIENETSLDRLIWHQHPQNTPDIDQYLKAAAKAIAKMHCAGIEHKDLHPGNILLSSASDQQAWVTDLQDCRAEQRSGHASADPNKHWRIKNLATIIAALQTRLSDAQIQRFVQEYLYAMQPNRPWQPVQQGTYLKRLLKTAKSHDLKMIAKRDRKCLKNTKYSHKIKFNGWSGHVFTAAKLPQNSSPVSKLTFSADQWKAALKDIDKLIDQGENIKISSNLSTVTKTILQIGSKTLSVVIKRQKLKSGLPGLLQTLRQSAAIRQWQRAHGLIARRIPTAWPLAALEHRPNGIITESIFITEEISNCFNLKLINLNWTSQPAIENLKTRKQTAQKIGKLIADLHIQHIKHRDCKASNIVLQRQPDRSYEPYLVDLEGITFPKPYIPYPPHRSLIRLGTAAVELPAITTADCLNTFNSYIQALKLPETYEKNRKKQLFNHLKNKIHRRANKTTKKVLAYYPIKDWAFRNILIIKPSSLGDVARCVSILHALRRRYPKAQISWLARPDCAGILPKPPVLNRIIPFDRKHLGKMYYNPFALNDFIKLTRQLSTCGFDLVLDFQGLFRSGFLTFCTGAPVRIGFKDARELAPIFYNLKIPLPQTPEHVVESYWRLTEPLGVEPANIADKATNTDRLACKLSPQFNLTPNQYIIMLIGGTEPTKQWPPESFAELAQNINKRYHNQIVLIGAGPSEADAAEQVCKIIGTEIVNLVNKTKISQLPTLLANAKLVIGNDSGPLHIAAAWNVPTIGIYGPTNPQVVGPYGQLDNVVQAGQNIERQGRYSKDPQHEIINITVGQVFKAVEEKLTPASKGSIDPDIEL